MRHLAQRKMNCQNIPKNKKQKNDTLRHVCADWKNKRLRRDSNGRWTLEGEKAGTDGGTDGQTKWTNPPTDNLTRRRTSMQTEISFLSNRLWSMLYESLSPFLGRPGFCSLRGILLWAWHRFRSSSIRSGDVDRCMALEQSENWDGKWKY